MYFVLLFPVLFFFLMLTISVSMNVWDALDERVNEINSKHSDYNTDAYNTDDLVEYPFELTVVEEALEDDYLSDDFYYT